MSTTDLLFHTDKVCYKALTSPLLKVRGNPSFFMISDPTVRLWYHCCHYMDLYPSRMEWGRVGGLLLKKKLCESEQESGTSVPRLISGFVFFKQTLTNLLKIPTEPSSQPALTRLSMRHTSSGLANSQHQSNIKASGCRWRGRCVLKNPHFLTNIKKQAKSLPLKQSWTRLLWVI